MQQILLLHGAIGAADQFSLLQEELADSFTVHSLNFSGHGSSPFVAASFSIDQYCWIQHGRVYCHVPGNTSSGKDKQNNYPGHQIQVG